MATALGRGLLPLHDDMKASAAQRLAAATALCEIGAKGLALPGFDATLLGSMEAEAEDEAIRLSAAGTPVDPGTPLSMVEGGEAVLAEVPADLNIARNVAGEVGGGGRPTGASGAGSKHQIHHNRRGTWRGQTPDAKALTKVAPDTRTAPDTPAAATPAPDPSLAPDTPAAPDTKTAPDTLKSAATAEEEEEGEWATPGLGDPETPEPRRLSRVSADQDLARDAADVCGGGGGGGDALLQG